MSLALWQIWDKGKLNLSAGIEGRVKGKKINGQKSLFPIIFAEHLAEDWQKVTKYHQQ